MSCECEDFHNFLHSHGQEQFAVAVFKRLVPPFPEWIPQGERMPFTVFPVIRGSDGMPALGGKGPGASTAPVTMTVAAHGFRGAIVRGTI